MLVSRQVHVILPSRVKIKIIVESSLENSSPLQGGFSQHVNKVANGLQSADEEAMLFNPRDNNASTKNTGSISTATAAAGITFRAISLETAPDPQPTSSTETFLVMPSNLNVDLSCF